MWRSIRAPILAREGDTASALELAREAIALSQRTEIPTLQADALSEYAATLLLAGEPNQAKTAIDDAIALYETKGDLASLGRARNWAQSQSLQ